MSGNHSGGWQIPATQILGAVRLLAGDRRAATAAEYAIILGIIGGSIALAAITLGDSIGCSIDRSAAIVAGDPLDPAHQYGNSNPNGLAKGHRTNC